MAVINNNWFENTPPDWSAPGVEPKDSIKESGFTAGYKPPAAYFNWFWTKVSKGLKEIQEKIKDLWTFITSSEIIIKEDIGSVSDVSALETLFSQGNNTGKRSYLFQFFVSGSLATFFGVAAGTQAELIARYSDITYIVYIPLYDKTFTYTKHGVKYTWAEREIPGSQIAEGSISFEKINGLQNEFDSLIAKDKEHFKVKYLKEYTCSSIADAYTKYLEYMNSYDYLVISLDPNLGLGIIAKIDCFLGNLYLKDGTVYKDDGSSFIKAT